MQKIVFIYTTVETIEQAQELVQKLLEQKLIACANMRPHLSMFMWDGAIACEDEIGILLKTTVRTSNDAQRVLFAEHPYKEPCIVSSPVDASSSFALWVEQTCGRGD